MKRGSRAVGAVSPGLVLLLSGLVFSCTRPEDDGSRGPSDDGDPFAGTPLDGPLPEIGPPPEDYRPTAAGAPATDIWIGVLDRVGGRPVVRDLFNATDRNGYDNQPSFDPGGEVLYYTSAVDSTQTEVFRYVFATGVSQRVTRTADASEFSPTVIPGQDALSAIREQNGKQYLWRYRTDGSERQAVFSTAEPVGYHAWADERTAVMFILGDPPTLQAGDALSGEIRVVARNPGRSIHRIPGTAAVSFVRKSEDAWWIERFDPFSGNTEPLTRTLTGREDYAWTPEGEILMGDGAVLYAWRAGGGWARIRDLAREDAGDISRIAVSPDGSRIALVRNRPGSQEPGE